MHPDALEKNSCGCWSRHHMLRCLGCLLYASKILSHLQNRYVLEKCRCVRIRLTEQCSLFKLSWECYCIVIEKRWRRMLCGYWTLPSVQFLKSFYSFVPSCHETYFCEQIFSTDRGMNLKLHGLFFFRNEQASKILPVWCALFSCSFMFTGVWFVYLLYGQLAVWVAIPWSDF